MPDTLTSPLLGALQDDLRARQRASLIRSRSTLESAQGVEPVIDGRRVLAFCSNDYLGLAAHPQVRAALARSAGSDGVGAGASHLISGHHREHAELEEALADFTGRERALLFSTGYMANLAVAATLAGPRDAVFLDRLSHASLIDGARLSGARLRRYRHGDAAHLERLLVSSRGHRELVLTDGVFSMDGDVAPLRALAETCRRHAACLAVDDAHGLGVVGPGGRGSVAAAGLGAADVPFLVGTLGKALGTFGAFVAGDVEPMEALLQRARPYAYTTALPIPIAAATRASLSIARNEPWRRAHLSALVERFRAQASELGLPLADSQTPIQPILIGAVQPALAAATALLERGIFVPAIRPPTVPNNAARLRVAFSAAHTFQHVDRLLDALAAVLR